MIRLQSLVTGGRLPFYNPPGTLNQTPDFTPDGKRIVFLQQHGEGGPAGNLHRRCGWPQR